MASATAGELIRYSLQLAVGFVFLAASASKLADIKAFRLTVLGYAIVPAALVTTVAFVTVVVEITIGAALLAGYLVAAAVPTGLAALAAFALGISVNLIRGRRIPCGCFGSRADTISARSLMRIALLTIPLAALAVFGGSGTTSRALISGGAEGVPLLIEVTSLAVFLLILGTWLLALPEVARSLGLEPPWKKHSKEVASA